MSTPERRLTNIDLEALKLSTHDSCVRLEAALVLDLVAEIRQSRELLAKIGLSNITMHVETVGLYRFEAPWAFEDDEKRLSIGEVIRRHLDRRLGDPR